MIDAKNEKIKMIDAENEKIKMTLHQNRINSPLGVEMWNMFHLEKKKKTKKKKTTRKQ